MPKPPLVGGKRWLSDIDREHMREDAEEIERGYDEFERWLGRVPLKPDLPDDAFDETDPNDRLREEGGRL